MNVKMEWWKILVIVIMLEVAFFTGAILRERENIVKRETKYLVKEKEVQNPVYINQSPEIPEKGESITLKGIGIHPDEETGEIVNLTVTLAQGNGEVFVEVSENTYGANFQTSIRNIKQAVETLTQQSLNNSLIWVDSTAKGSLQGSSGSLAIGTGLYSLIMKEEPNNHTAITGVLHQKGDVGPVAMLQKKVEIAEEKEGIEEVIVPGGQCEEIQKPEGIKVRCVNSLKEAVNVIID